MATWRAFRVPWTRRVKSGGIQGARGHDAALIAGMLAAALPFQVMFTMAIAYLTTKPLAERVLATADQLAASKGQAEGTDVEVHDWKADGYSVSGRPAVGPYLLGDTEEGQQAKLPAPTKPFGAVCARQLLLH